MIWQTGEDLAERILSESKPPVFIVGSGLAAPSVPGTDEMVKLIRKELRHGNPTSVENLDKALEAEGNRYQVAFEQLFRVRGANAVNRVIRHAVLQAQKDGQDSALLAAAREGNRDACEALGDDVESWRLTEGVAALGSIVTRLARPKLCVVTTNFDPLIDIAVKRAGGHVISVADAQDSDPFAAHQAGAVLVAHVHGHWYRADSLHLPSVLTAERPRLKAALRNLMAERLIIVLGYAGWDDSITRALDLLVHDSQAQYELHWAFRESEPAAIEKRYAQLLARLRPALDVRAHLHAGVDSHEFLPRLAQALATRSAPPAPPMARDTRPPGPPAPPDEAPVGRPRVYISYSWNTEGMKTKAMALAEKLRARGIDSRLDLYHGQSRHGFLPPEDWTVWQQQEIVEADRVLVICSPEYHISLQATDPSAWGGGVRNDVRFMKQDLQSHGARPGKFIPVGFGRYEQLAPFVPDFMRGAHYYDLDATDEHGYAFDALVRRFRTEFPRRT
ncbi:MAG TPA: toll/interleukin-1 receptor domain-containing protein [Polyangia bacterium]|nr:toll/interleukin-1 receptor domain-containing protein [Polyangia bacterium]